MMYKVRNGWRISLLLLLAACAGMAPSGGTDRDAEMANVNTEANSDQQSHTTGTLVLQEGDDVATLFRKAGANKSIKKILFEPGDYFISDTLILPRTGGLLIIDGQGANLSTKGVIPLFYSMPSNQSQAMQWNKTRYIIQNFGAISGGSRGIFLGSSFNSVIRNIEFIGQQEAAIDLVFCLMTTIEQVLVTNVFNDGIVLRSGQEVHTNKKAWEGASFNNSQCNHTKLQSCRVYNKKGCTGTSFKILQSTGVRLVDCISEGWENRKAVFFDAEGCTTAKYFCIDNFHLEHQPTDGALCFRSFGSLVEVNGLFLQKGNRESPAIWLMNNGNYVFKNIPWWPSGAWVKSSHSPCVVISQCANEFSQIQKYWVNDEKKGEVIYPKYITVSEKLVR